MRIAIVQQDCRLGDKAHNLQSASSLIRQAAEAGAHLILFPELFLTGYFLNRDLVKLAEEVSGPSVHQLAKLAKTHAIHICIGLAEKQLEPESIFNAMVCLSAEGRIVAVYRKAHLYDAEKDYFTPGNEAVVAETAIGRLGLAICYDLEFPEWPRVLALQGAQLLLVATANMEPWDVYQEVYTKARAMENQMFVALANRIGKDDNYVFCGDSLLVDPMGRILARAQKNSPALLVSDLDLESINRIRDSSINYFRDRRAQLYGLIGSLRQPKHPAAPPTWQHKYGGSDRQ